MIADVANIKDIVLDLVPQSVAVQNPQVLQQGEEEQVPLPLPSHEVGLPCPTCGRKILFIVLASPAALRDFQRLILSSTLKFVCVHCVRASGILDHRRHNGR